MTSPPIPFFIGGAGRSGSTYLYYILRAHPKVALTNESRVLDALGLAMEAVTLPYGEKSASGLLGLIAKESAPVLGQILAAQLKPMLLRYYEHEFGRGFTHYGDKLAGPEVIAIAQRAFPETRVILLLRDPRDVVASYLALQRADFAKGKRGSEMDEADPLHFASIWARTYQAFLDAGTKALVIPYVRLLKETQVTVGAALRHLGLRDDPRVGAAISENDTIGGHGTSQTALASIGRYRRDLDQSLAAQIHKLCAPTWRAICEAYADSPLMQEQSL